MTAKKLHLWAAFLAVLGAWLAAAATLPIVQDEAYYFAWSRHLALGYFDHPPLVAVLGMPSLIADHCPLLARSGTLLAALLTMLAATRFYRLIGFRSSSANATALLLAFGNLMGLVLGVITTPDSLMMLAWVLALLFCYQSRRSPRYWLAAGLVTGLGLWSKYMMLLIGPVFLISLIAQWVAARRNGERPQLLTPWPYLGGLIALLVFAPHLQWNARNDWITFKFQMRHGLAMERPDLAAKGQLPLALKPDPDEDSPQTRLAKPFTDLVQAEKRAERRERPWDQAVKALNASLGFYAAQAAIWGGAGVALLLAMRSRRRQRRGDAPAGGESDAVLNPDARPLLWASALVPLGLFGLLSLVSKVEANWSAMYVFGAAALMTPLLLGRPRLLRRGVVANVLILLLAAAHGRWGLLPTRPHSDRLLGETHGYPALAGALGDLTAPVFADSYQIVAMVSYWNPRLRIRQWPGITRDSEFVRNAWWSDLGSEALGREPFFWLVTTDLLPPILPGFTPDQMSQLRDCKGTGLQVISSLQADAASLRCRKPVHEWYLLRYAPDPQSDPKANHAASASFWSPTTKI